MENKRLLIVGIDPGITAAYAILDIEGNVIEINSSKQLDLSQLINEAIKIGKVVLVGTDKENTPRLVEAFATKLGARTVSPREDLKVEEKRKMVSGFHFDNEHQGDALASALFAYNSTKSLLDKIDFFAEGNKKQAIKDKIKELVILKKISIKNAVSIIEGKNEEDKIIKNITFEKKLNENDFLRIYSKLKRYESEINLIKDYNGNLKARIENLEKNDKSHDEKNKGKTLIDFREKRIRFLENTMRLKEKDNRQLELLLEKICSSILNINNSCILKKLNSLGLNEFNFKNKILNIQRNDTLLVDDPNIVSANVVDLLKNRVFVIVHKKPISKKIENELPFVFIKAQSLKIQEYKYFGLVDKKHFEIEKNKLGWIKKIITDYQKEKEQLTGNNLVS